MQAEAGMCMAAADLAGVGATMRVSEGIITTSIREREAMKDSRRVTQPRYTTCSKWLARPGTDI